MRFRNMLISFSVFIILSFSIADLVFSCCIDDQKNTISHSLVKSKIKKDKKSKKPKQEQKQSKTPLIQMQHPTTKNGGFTKNPAVSCLEEVGDKELRKLLQEKSKSIILNDLKISIISIIEKETIKKLCSSNSSQISAILNTVILPPSSQNNLKLKGDAVTGEYFLYRDDSLIDISPITIRFTRSTSVSDGA